MALKKNEKTLIGVVLLAASVALVMAMGLPQWDSYTTSNDQLNSLKEDVKNTQAQKETLAAQIALLERNTDIPPGIEIKTYTEQNREQVIKQLLDGVVEVATTAGNKFISLTPVTVDPILPPPPPETTGDNKNGSGNNNSTTAQTDANGEEKAPVLPPPILSTFGYELSVRGSYETVQRFLRAMDDQKTLLEINGITVGNEILSSPLTGSANQAPEVSVAPDPNLPIRLKAKLRITLQPVQ